MASSVYIHIPFCDHICSYCDFCKVFYKEDWADRYLDALAFEIEDKIIDFNGDMDLLIKNEDGSFSILDFKTNKNINCPIFFLILSICFYFILFF